MKTPHNKAIPSPRAVKNPFHQSAARATGFSPLIRIYFWFHILSTNTWIFLSPLGPIYSRGGYLETLIIRNSPLFGLLSQLIKTHIFHWILDSLNLLLGWSIHTKVSSLPIHELDCKGSSLYVSRYGCYKV